MYHQIYTKHRATFGAMNRSIIGFLQVIGNIGKLVRWPTEFAVVTSWFAFFKLSFDVPSVGCVIHRASEYTFFDRLLLYCLAPVAIIAVLNLPLAWAWLRQGPTALRDEVCMRCVNWTLRVLFVVYPMVSQLVISALVCKQLGPDLWLLSYDYRVNCLEARYEQVKKFALAMLVVWVIGYPLSMLIVLKVYKVPEMAARKQTKAELHALLWHTLKLSPGGPPIRPRVVAATSMTAVTTDWLAGEAGTLRELSADTLTWLCRAHKLDVGVVGMPCAGALAAALETLVAELMDSEDLAVPRVRWDPQSADAGERLACAHIGSLFESYEPEWWWYASLIRLVPPQSGPQCPTDRFASMQEVVRAWWPWAGLTSSKVSAS